MKKRYIFYAIILLGLAYLIYNRITTNKKMDGGAGKGGAKGGQSAIAVEGVVVKSTSFSNQIEISGTVEANEEVVLKSEVSGLITRINFKEGNLVTKGQLLIKINDRDIQAQLQDALTKQNLSATIEKRSKLLLEKGAISQEEYDTSLADLQSLKSQAQLVRAQLAKTSIVAPFSGRIGLRSISVGEYITPATVIANLVSTNPVKISFSVPEKYAAQVELNSTISFTMDGSGKKFTGNVYALEPGINQQTRTLQIRALTQNPKNELLPGSFVQIKLSLDAIPNAILVPSQAIIPVLEGKTVFISKNGKAKQVAVEASIRTADSVVIDKGLKAGDTVLTTGSLSLKSGASVKVNLGKAKQ